MGKTSPRYGTKKPTDDSTGSIRTRWDGLLIIGAIHERSGLDSAEYWKTTVTEQGGVPRAPPPVHL